MPFMPAIAIPFVLKVQSEVSRSLYSESPGTMLPDCEPL